MTVYIYLLVDPRTDEIRYVGKTKQLDTRVVNHMAPTNLKANTHKNNWLKQLRAAGLNPTIVPIDEADTTKRINELEEYWIHQMLVWGQRLTNGTKGGDGGATITGRKHSAETRAKITAANLGRKVTEEAKAKISVAVSKSLIGNKRAVGSKGWVGKKHREESIDKMRMSHPFRKVINQYEKDGSLVASYDSVHAAAEATGIHRTTIARCCNPEYVSYKTGGGFVWSYGL